MSPAYTNTAATFSADMRYRYHLSRQWALPITAGEDRGACMFLMLNPSTADIKLDDPTIRRCVGFASSWGFSGLSVCNIFALRSTDPAALYTTPDPVGPTNDLNIEGTARTCCLIIAAWGVHGEYMNRGVQVLRNLQAKGYTVHHLGLTSGGHPKHPLYLPKTSTPVPFEPGKVSIK